MTLKMHKIVYFGLFICCLLNRQQLVVAEDDDEGLVETETVVEEEEIDINYVTPSDPPNSYLLETFDDYDNYVKKWIKSKAKKDGVDVEIAKYDGVWAVEALEKDSLPDDLGLVLKSKAKHAAISIPLKKVFQFNSKPFIVQYEVALQTGQECGGAYIKLLSHKSTGNDLKNFGDKTPYTIMFGPDKCGNDHKLHFIFRHVNPINGGIEEKHAKKPDDKLEESFKDKKTHLYTLIVRPDNTYEIRLDHDVVNKGNLLDDFTPSVNPPKDIDDVNDFKPEDWDEREKIVDDAATKPVYWDEEAPMQVEDPSATMPEGWLEEEPEMIADPDAMKQDDWDDDMDGEWEAPLINNPKCSSAPGCGEWRVPMIDNPEYKGKWKPPMMNNPNYRGKWTPRLVPNPDFFEDLEPFKMTPIAAVGIELWSMSSGIYFDNILITDDENEAYQFAQETFDLKVAKMEHGRVGVFNRILKYSNKNPWLYGIYVLLIAIPVVLIIACCCAEESKPKDGDKKKTDEPTEDDPHSADDDKVTGKAAEDDDDEGNYDDEEEGEDEDNSAEPSQEEENGTEQSQEEEKAAVPSQEEEKAAEPSQEEEKAAEPSQEEEKAADVQEFEPEPITRTSPRLRKSRKE